jgi:rhamnulokinase
MPSRFIAVDLGASSARVIVSHWNGERFSTEELHRFPNGGVAVGQTLYWNVLSLWEQVQDGMRKFHARYREAPAAIGVDAWGVDFGLLDGRGRLIGNPVHYRDRRTNGMPEQLFEVVPEAEIFAETGVQTMAINTLFQLYAMSMSCDDQLMAAHTLLMIPDLFNYFLGGEKCVEYTQATTTQMYSIASCGWAKEILDRVGISSRILPEIVQPGTILSMVRPETLLHCGFDRTFPVVAVGSHDTASAVAAIPHMDDASSCLSSGTWSLMGAQIAKPNTSRRAFELGFTNEGGADGRMFLLKNLTGLWILQECLEQWRLEHQSYTWDEIVQAAATAAPLRSIFDPNDRRLKTPGRVLQALAECCGESGQPVPETVGQVARAAFESLSLKYRSTLVSLEELTGRTLKTIRLVGGGSRNALFSQMIADACNRTVVAGPVEASALGNAMLQAVTLGEITNYESGREAIAASVDCTVYYPRPSDPWEEVYRLFRSIEEA